MISHVACYVIAENYVSLIVFFGVSNFSLYNLKKLGCCGKDGEIYKTLYFMQPFNGGQFNAKGRYTIQIGFYSLSYHRLTHNPDLGAYFFLITDSF